jgi:hypothetical protein
MCMACEEMQLFYAYLDAVEEAKRKAQPWQCEVTVFSEDGSPIQVAPAQQPQANGFACDDGTDGQAAPGFAVQPAKP